MEPTKLKLLDRVDLVCREQLVLPALVERYRKCVYDFLLFLKSASDKFIEPQSVGRDRVVSYLTDLGDRRRVSLENRLLAFEVLRLLYEHVLVMPGVVVDHRQQLFRRFADKIAELHYSPKTEKTYWSWCVDFLDFAKIVPWDNDYRSKFTAPLVEEWLTSLATKRYVTANTQNLALQSVLFLAKRLLGIEISDVDALRAKRSETLPAVLSREQIWSVLEALGKLTDPAKLVQTMLGYGCGMRVSESITLRIKDCLFDRRQITIRDAKGRVDRVVPLPDVLAPLLKAQIEAARTWHTLDLREGCARVPLPGAFHIKSSKAESDWGWFWVFPSHIRSECPKTKRIGRFHIDESCINRTLNAIGRKLGIPERLHFHTLRHSFATHMLDDGVNIRQVQKLLAHKNLETTMRYTHVALTGPASKRSPLDSLQRMRPRQSLERIPPIKRLNLVS